MEAFFLKLVNLSITSGWMVLAVLLLRLLFRKAPKRIYCLLWGLVALRLVCPVSIESALSLIPSAEPLPGDILYTERPEIHSGIEAVDDIVNPVLSDTMTPAPGSSVNPTQVWSFLFSRLWAAGAACMLLYALVSAILIKRRVAAATRLTGNIMQCERVDSPFVLGLLRPVIYLPYSLKEPDLGYVIAHEQAHIRRKDHWWKPAGFVLLSVYWFNPLLWAAYILLCRDIEAACDELVIREMEKDARKAYASALLRCSIRQRSVAACPLAFGETGVKERVKYIMNYKKPAFWLVLLAAAAALTAAVCLLTVPKQDGQESAADPWGTRIEGLAWGMSPQEAEEKCDLVYRETSDQTKRSSYDVKDPVTIYGCEMSAALIFEEDQGLVQVQGQVAEEDFEKLSDRITEELGEAPSDSEAGQYYIWRSETVGEKYTREQVEGVYAPLLEGISVDLDEMVKAKMAAPLASCELRRYQSEAGGLLLIDAVNKGFFEKNWQEGYGESYSCDQIPFGDGKLQWGMSRDEIVEVLGTPASEEATDYMGGSVNLIYGSGVSGELGKCEQITMTVLEDSPAISGLGYVQMIVQDTTKEAVVDKLEAFYGDFSEGSGAIVSMEQVFQDVNPNFFWEGYFRDDWKFGSLKEEEFDAMREYVDRIYASGEVPYSGPKEDDLLLRIRVVGTEGVDFCRVDLDSTGLLLYRAANPAK